MNFIAPRLAMCPTCKQLFPVDNFNHNCEVEGRKAFYKQDHLFRWLICMTKEPTNKQDQEGTCRHCPGINGNHAFHCPNNYTF